MILNVLHLCKERTSSRTITYGFIIKVQALSNTLPLQELSHSKYEVPNSMQQSLSREPDSPTASQ
jgi:hypothetical protein